MACDYEEIRRDNKRRYGTDIGRIGSMLLADRYDDSTHFIFELLQNAEDALARRTGPQLSRSVNFQLTEKALHVSHFGQPFDEPDVRGICGIGESTKKGLTTIGHFGIGFKSVYAFTDLPEIHSGNEDFSVNTYVLPTAVSPLDRNAEETMIVIPLRASDEIAHSKIAGGLERLGASTLLFLRQIEEIHWSVAEGQSGTYLRESKEIDERVRRVTVIGQEHEKDEVDEEWLVFSRIVTHDGEQVGHVEIAFAIGRDEKSEFERIRPVEQAPLVVFFPTVVETHLGFLIQGPYRTTPSRDNVPRNDPWNQQLVVETSSLLIEALRWLRDHMLLDTTALQCLPLDPTNFGETSMFRPLFDGTKQALSSEHLLPRFDTKHVSAVRARLGRTQELRNLFSPAQLAALYEEEDELAWLTGDITQDRTPELRQYLMQELNVIEITPEALIPRLHQRFLEAQPDTWVLNLYEFLDGQSALRRRLDDLPLIRLEDGRHVAPQIDGQPQAFLPSTIRTSFPTVRSSVCSTDTARKFLESLGLAEPNLVDDVIRNLLPKYQRDESDISNADYDADIQHICTAFATDSKAQRDKLIVALRETPFVLAVDAGDGTKRHAKPDEVYLATDRLKGLFDGVAGILLVDDSYDCLHGEKVRVLLEACGGVRYLRPVPNSNLSSEEKEELRAQAGHAETSGYKDRVIDWKLNGLKELLETLPNLEIDEREKKANALWAELAYLEERRGNEIFSGEYTWSHYGDYRASFDASFVKRLNEIPWVLDEDGQLQCPPIVLFDSLDWKPNPFLQSKIRFKPPLIEQLAKEAGIEPGMLVLLKILGVTSEAELRRRLKIEDPAPKAEGGKPNNGKQPAETERPGSGSGGKNSGKGARQPESPGPRSDQQPREGGARPRVFISYVGAHPDEGEPDPDGLDHAVRMELEEQAIAFILSQEPNWQRTPSNNHGYDLFQAEEDGNPILWCEVKAMKRSLHDRPVGLSHTQFGWAQKYGEAYWLYIVEHAGSNTARLIRIQDPAGRARTFTFDHGWLDIADADRRCCWR